MADTNRQPEPAPPGRGPSRGLPPVGPEAAREPAIDVSDASCETGDTDAFDGVPSPPVGENLVLLQFKGRRKSYYHNRRGVALKVGDHCLVEADRGRDLGRVTYIGPGRPEWWDVAHRQGVLQLAAVFRARIELRQIGVRDETRLQGGLAMCGREYCCAGFLQEFVPVTLKMAKTQQLPLNPAKLSGPCGRLRCCLAFEDDHYREARRRLPRVGATVVTPEGPATVRQTDLLRETVMVDGREPGRLVEWPVDRLQWDDAPAAVAPHAPRDGGCPGCSRGSE